MKTYRRCKKTVYEQSGVTLVEVIVVVVIVALIAAAAIPGLIGFYSASDSKQCVVDRYNVMSAYAKAYVDDGYDQSDEERSEDIKEAVEQYGGTYISDESYKGKCGGTCTITYSANYDSITDIMCSEHGGLHGEAAPEAGMKDSGGDNSASGANQIKDALIDVLGTVSGKRIDSTNPDGTSNKAVEEKLNGVFENFGIKAWKLNVSAVIWITDVDITTLPAGTQVKVIRYNTTRNTYTAGYVPISQGTSSAGNSFMTFPDADYAKSGWEYPGQNNSTKASYDETLAIYLTMPDTR